MALDLYPSLVYFQTVDEDTITVDSSSTIDNTGQSQFYSATASSNYPLAATKVNNTSTFGAATVTPGTVNLSPTKLDNTNLTGSISYITDVANQSNVAAATWTRVGINNYTNVDGIADRIEANLASSGNQRGIYDTVNSVSGTQYTISVKFKYFDHRYVQVLFGGDGWGTTKYVNIDLQTLATSAGAGIDSVTVTQMPDGYVWVQLKGTATATYTGTIVSVWLVSALAVGTTGRAQFWNPSTAISVIVKEFTAYSSSGPIADITQSVNVQPLTATTVTNTSTFGSPVATNLNTLTPTKVNNTSTFGTDVVSTTYSATTTKVNNTSTFGTAVVSYPIVTTKVNNTSTFNNVFLQGGGATNLLGFSEQLGNTNKWFAYQSSVSNNAIEAPNGTTTAEKINETALVASEYFVSQTQTLSAGQYTYSVFVKAAERDEVEVFVYNNDTGGGVTHILNLTSGTTVSGPFTYGTGITRNSYTVVPTVNGWYRVIWTFTIASSYSIAFGVKPFKSLTNFYNGTAGEGLYAWGAQLVSGSSAGNYSLTVAPNADLTATKVDNTSIFGTQVATYLNTLLPAKVNNTSTFGTPAVTTTRGLTPTKVNNTSTFGTHTISASAIINTTLYPSVVYSHTVDETDITVDENFTVDASINEIHSATITAINYVTTTKLNNSSTFGSHTVVPGTATLVAPHVVNTATFRPTVATLGRIFYPPSLTNTSTFGAAVVSASYTATATKYTQTNEYGIVTVSLEVYPIVPTKVTNTSTFGSTTVSSVYALTATKVNNTSTFGSQEVIPDQDLAPTKVTNSSTFGTPVATATRNLTTTKVNNTSTFGNATVSTGGISLVTTTVTNTSTFGTAVVGRGANALTPTKVTNTSTFGAATVGRGAVSLVPTTATNTSTFGTPVASSVYTIAPISITNTSTFGTPVQTNVRTLLPVKVTNQHTFGASVVLKNQALAPSKVNNTTTFGVPNVVRGQFLDVGIFTNSSNIAAPVVTLLGVASLSPTKFSGNNVFGTPIVRNGNRMSPVSDFYNSGWTNEVNSNNSLWDSVNEDINSYNEEDYITDTGTGTNRIRFRLESPNVTITNKNNHKVRYKVRKEIGTNPRLTVRLYQGDIQVAVWRHTDLPTSYTLFERTLTVDQAILLSGYDNLYIEFVTEY
jgi:hypothetical protein